MSKKNHIFQKIDYYYAFLVLFLGFAFVQFVLLNTTGFFTTFFFLSLLFVARLYLKKAQAVFTLFSNLLYLILILFSFVYSLTDNNLIKLCTSLFLICLGVFWIYLTRQGYDKLSFFWELEFLYALFCLPMHFFSALFSALLDALHLQKRSRAVVSIILGIVLTLPLTLLVLILLVQADPRMEMLLSSFLQYVHFDYGEVILKLLIAIPVSAYFFGMLYGNVHQQPINLLITYQEKKKAIKRIPSLALCAGASPICLLYLIFIFSQLSYFVSGFLGQLPADFTYAEYARRGFFELFFISCINFSLVLFFLYTVKTDKTTPPLSIRLFSGLLCIFTLFILLTEFTKMFLYMNQFGLTPLRVYVTWFLFLLLLIFIFILLYLFNHAFPVIRVTGITFFLLFAGLCFSNTDALIVKYNIYAYETGLIEELDIDSMLNLSDDGKLAILLADVSLTPQQKNQLSEIDIHPYSSFNLSTLRFNDALLKQE